MIAKIEVNNYRLLKEFSADLGNLTVIIGANAVGKSTLMDCLQCIAQCVEFPLNTVFGRHWGLASLLSAGATRDAKLTWQLTFKKPESGYLSQIPMEDKELVYEVELKSDMQNQASVQHEILRNLDPSPGYPNPLKYLESTPHLRQIYNRRSRKLESFDEAVGRKSDASSFDNVEALPSKVEETALMLSQIRFFNEFPIPSAARILIANMAFYPGFDISRDSAFRSKPAEIKPATTLYARGENLGTVLHEILTRYEYRSAANELHEFLSAAYGTFEAIHCDTTYGTPAQVLVRIREKGMPRSMELYELSDGMVRFLCLAAALLNPISPPLIAIDEPEAGFHPRLLPIVADMIKTASERTQVLITTHSPDLLNRFDIDDVAVMTRDEDAVKTVWHRPGDRKTLVQMLNSVEGESLGDLHRSGELEAL
jgi:predicted ATPase